MTVTETSYERCIRLIKAAVADLNEELSLSTDFDSDMRRDCVTFGYIGNCERGAEGTGRDYRQHMVFLPKTGPLDSAHSVGGFDTNDHKGAQACLAQVAAMLRGVRLAKALS